MPIMVKENKKILFVHIPKCGGSSLEHRLSVNSWNEYFSIRGLNANELSFVKCSPQHLHLNVLETFLNLKAFDKIVTLVRNPFDRFKSEYYWQVKQGITEEAPSTWIYRMFQEYEINPYCFDNHIRPQSEFINSLTKVFKLENNGVDEAFKYIEQSSHNKLSIKAGLAKFRRRNLKYTKKNPMIDNIFEANKEAIVKFYSDDFKLLGY